MKTFDFPYYISFGKGDNVDSCISCELSDEKAKRLERSAKEGGRFRLSEDEEIEDIYDEVYTAILENDVGETDLDSLEVGINYPVELQYLERTVRRRIKQTVCDSVVLDRVQAEVFLKHDKDKIIYTDEGQTLYYIPKDFQGKFVVENVSRVERDVFVKCKKLTEVVIEAGITEITDSMFDECIRLRQVTAAGTVKRIGYNAFTKCEDLKKVVLSEGIKEIDDAAFRFCRELHELVIPSTVVSINAFIGSYYNGLTDLYFKGINTYVDDARGGDLRGITLHVLPGSKAEEYAKLNNKRFKYL